MEETPKCPKCGGREFSSIARTNNGEIFAWQCNICHKCQPNDFITIDTNIDSHLMGGICRG